MTGLPATAPHQRMSLRRFLLLGILVPVGLFVIINAFSLYRQTLGAVNVAYDRTLLASAKSIGELLDVQGFDDEAQLRVTVPYAALEAFEADNQSRMFYRVSTKRGDLVSGFAELAAWHGTLPDRNTYAALVDFYDDTFRGEPVRVAVLLQPVASQNGRGMAVIQVAETLELRHTLTRQILVDTLWRQAVLVAVIALVAVLVIQRATQPVRNLSQAMDQRREGDLTAIAAPDAPRELLPLVEATNHVMARLAHLLENQKRFVRDTAHQLRTPLAVLKTQAQSALRGDIEARQALRDINDTVDRATVLANQMLSLAKVEQLRQQRERLSTDLASITRSIALELSPLVAGKDLDFEIDTVPAVVDAHEWMLRELTRNLLHNAIQHSPPGGALSVRLVTDANSAALTIADNGPGIAADLRKRLFQPFSAGNQLSGSGLGLAICREIVDALDGTLSLDNRQVHGRVEGLDTTVRLPLRDNTR